MFISFRNQCILDESLETDKVGFKLHKAYKYDTNILYFIDYELPKNHLFLRSRFVLKGKIMPQTCFF